MSNLAQTTVLGLLVYELTRSELDLGFLGLAEFAPAALLVLVAGAAADRFDRRRVTAVGALADAVVALALAWYVHRPAGLSTTPIFLLVLAFGAGQAFLSPALRSLPAAMVANEGVPWLVARRSIAGQTATIIGPVLGRPALRGGGVGAARRRRRTFRRRRGVGPGHPVARPGGGGWRRRPADPVGDDQVDHVLEDGIPASGGRPSRGAGRPAICPRPVDRPGCHLPRPVRGALRGGRDPSARHRRAPARGAVGLGWLRAAAGLGAGA